MHGSNWSDSTGQGKGKITLHKMIIQFLRKRNKSPLLPHTSPAVSNRPLCQRNCFYDGSGAFIMTAQGTNTAQHQTAWELWFQAKCNKRREPTYTREMKTVLVDYGGSIMFSLQRISFPHLAQSSWGILFLFQLLWTSLPPPENTRLLSGKERPEHKGNNSPFTAPGPSSMGKDFKCK